jgi:hypothetical protein
MELFICLVVVALVCWYASLTMRKSAAGPKHFIGTVRGRIR